MSNHKTHAIKNAMKAFLKDLQQDPDFLSFKQRCMIDTYSSYGVVVSAYKRYVLQLKDNNETTIVNHLKSCHA